MHDLKMVLYNYNKTLLLSMVKKIEFRALLLLFFNKFIQVLFEEGKE
jgi:hypothetical protein